MALQEFSTDSDKESDIFDSTADLDFDILDHVTIEEIIEDYRIAYRSRQMSLIGRQEVLSGRAKFGIFGDGKEIPQVAMARFFRHGDFRSGYYRDQTLMMALGELTVKQFFAQLYAHTDIDAEPASGGRMMNAHFVTKSLNEDGSWRNLTEQYNTSADISPTAGQMPRLVGLAYASKLYREVDELRQFTQFSNNGNEIAFGTIGNASTSEGHFWEAVNAIGVLKSPAVLSIWDDGYGISVSNKDQMVKEDLSALLSGFKIEDGTNGYNLYTVKGWDYSQLLRAYDQATDQARESHIPAIVHVVELTQPQGHSTSGSHERYKDDIRLQFEEDYDCLTKMRDWMLMEGIISEDVLSAYEAEDKQQVRSEQQEAWQEFVSSLDAERQEVSELIEDVASDSRYAQQLEKINQRMLKGVYPKRKEMLDAIFQTLKITRDEYIPAKQDLIDWRDEQLDYYNDLYGSHLLSDTVNSPMNVDEVKPIYDGQPQNVNGFVLLNQFFKKAFKRDPRLVTFGEDVGYLGGVNQTMAGMQEDFGAFRVADTGIREATIMGQAIGLAMRGLRPIAEIQYLDYLLYALQTMSDDLATLRWRTVAGQSAPVIIRTRGHRLEGIWHSGSLMAGIIHLVRGVHVLVPRDMTRAIGFYNTLMQGDDPALVVEALNGYRKKEALPSNLADITIPLGVPEVLHEGRDVTLVTYGSTCHIAMEAVQDLADVGIDVELIDVQSLLPFDIHGHILDSLKKTNRIVFLDEDVPGGTTAYMMQQVLEVQGGYHWLDSEPRTLSGKAHRPAYGTDGDYFSKPNKHDIFHTIYDMMNEADPANFPLFYTSDD